MITFRVILKSIKHFPYRSHGSLFANQSNIRSRIAFSYLSKIINNIVIKADTKFHWEQTVHFELKEIKRSTADSHKHLCNLPTTDDNDNGFTKYFKFQLISERSFKMELSFTMLRSMMTKTTSLIILSLLK